MGYQFRRFTAEHLEQAAEVLNHYIKHSTAAYRWEPVTGGELAGFLDGSPEVLYSCAVVDGEDRCVGFFLLEPHSPLPAFAGLAEAMYFLHPEHTGRGLGGRILQQLEEEARRRGIRKLLADISSENEGSIRFHRRRGFVEYGRLETAGRKFGRDFGIVYLAKELEREASL